MDIVKQYKEVAREFSHKYGVYDEHIISIVASVMMTRDKRGLPGGGFVQSVVANDLFSAVSRADNNCYANLKVIVAANQYAHLNQL
jgi:hypothetical protein